MEYSSCSQDLVNNYSRGYVSEISLAFRRGSKLTFASQARSRARRHKEFLRLDIRQRRWRSSDLDTKPIRDSGMNPQRGSSTL